jgi:hypothetical protein
MAKPSDKRADKLKAVNNRDKNIAIGRPKPRRSPAFKRRTVPSATVI